MDVKNPLGTLPRGSKIFIDANIFLYSIFGHPTLKPQCKEFLLKIENEIYESIVSSLSMTWRDYTDIKKYPIATLCIDENIMDMAVEISKKYGLLISDSVHVAVMNSNSIINIASNDADFERVKGIKVWSP